MSKPKWIACHNCDRGGRGNAKDKCACGHKVTEPGPFGCYLGTPIVGEPRKIEKVSRSKARYRRYLEFGDCFDSFIDFCRWDAQVQKEKLA